MLGKPHNDRACLDAITAEVAAKVDAADPALVAIAEQHADTASLIDWIRSLPQRDDEGIPCDGPKVHACHPPQRLRLPTDSPNCLERSAIYSAVAEMIDPDPVRRLATVDTPNGMHTFPTEDGVPVILDPTVSRNALRAGLFRIGRNALGDGSDVATRRLRLERLIGTDETRGVRGDLARARASKASGYTTWVNGEPIDDAIATYERALAGYQESLTALPRNATPRDCDAGPVALTPTEVVDWIAELAAEPGARFVDGTRRVHNGHRAMRAVLVGGVLRVADVGDVAFVLALAEREARLWGAPGPRIVRTCAHAIDRLDRAAARRWLATRGPRNLKIGRYQVRPNTPLLAALGRVGVRLGGNVVTQAVRIKLASMGVTPMVLGPIEQELNREGLSLGSLAAPPPMLGSLAALTPDAIAGRWLASRL
jgi:hypothetical protein